ncbi:MAG: penicillin acylase family protein [Desulfobacula sp.]|nr:penicillin acylase family protein [Desulfobacula sp.]
MKWLRRILILIIILTVCGGAFIFCLPLFNDYKTTGELQLPGLQDKVTVQRDAKGMAYIRAQNLDDLLMAQGFVTAQDRLFQMQLTRLLAQGRISELAGEAARNLDIRMRTIGLHRMAEKQARILNPKTAGQFQKYVDGINAFIENCPEDIHLEFKLAGLTPEKWDIADSLSIVYYMGYSTSANIDTEIIAQMLLETVGYEKAIQIMPLNFNPDDSNDKGSFPIPSKERLAFSKTSMTGIKKILPFLDDRKLRAGSNNWAVSPALSESGAPILSGDPHLDPRILPGVWYPIGLITPEIRSVGAHIAGIPGMAIGRTKTIAIAMTNNYGDMQDLYIETIDPDNANNYLEGDKSIPFITYNETLKIKDKEAPNGFRTQKLTIRATKRGPIVTGVLPTLKTRKLISFRFAPVESMTADIGLIDIFTAKNSADLISSIKKVPMVCLNWVFVDKDGNIGHQASGKIPIRKNGDGSFPHPVTDSSDNWLGWIPQDQMPGVLNPEKNWVGTCNHKTITSDYPYYYSSYFAASYRYQRLKELMATGKKSADTLWLYQRDTKNMMAKAIAPVMADILLKHDDSKEFGQILSDWDFMDDPDKAAPAIFQTIYTLFAKKVFEDDFGKENATIMLNSWYFWEERLQQMVLNGHSDWFDNINTNKKKETLEDLFYEAALEAKDLLIKKLGEDIKKWQWGTIHTLDLVNPLVRKGPAKDLFGTGAMPMGGSGETLYRGWYDYDKPFGITHCAALRMVADLSDDEKVMAVIPGGITGRTFHPHQKDQVKSYMTGKKLYWWFSDSAINAHTKSTLMLTP